MPRTLILGALVAAAACGGGPTPDHEPAKGLRFKIEPSDTASTDVVMKRQPVVQLVDANGSDTREAVTVTASVIAGSGAVISGETTTTDANGSAAFDELRLGAINGSAGPVLLQFTAPGLEPVQASVDLSCSVVPTELGGILNGKLTENDCAFRDGPYFDQYRLMLPLDVTPVRATMNAVFRTAIYFRGPNEPRFFWGQSAAPGANLSSIVVFAPAGEFRLAPNAESVGATGQYNLVKGLADEDLGCEVAWLASPIDYFPFRLGTGDCSNNGFLEDYYYVGLPLGASITVTALATGYDAYVDLWDHGGDGDQVAQAVGAPSASLSYQNLTGVDQVFLLRSTSASSAQSGSYSLAVHMQYPGAMLPTALVTTRRARSELAGRVPTPPVTGGRPRALSQR